MQQGGDKIPELALNEQAAARDSLMTKMDQKTTAILKKLPKKGFVDPALHETDPTQAIIQEVTGRANYADANAITGPGLDTPEKLLGWMDGERGRAAFAQGAWDSKRFEAAQLPNITRASLLRNRVWASVREARDGWADAVDEHFAMQKQLQYDHLTDIDKIRFRSSQQMQLQFARTQTAAGNFMKRISQPSFGGVLPIMGRDAGTQFDAALRMGAPSGELMDTWSRFMVAPNAAARREVADQAMDSMMRNLGWHVTDKAGYEEWRNRVGGRMQSYSAKPRLAIMGSSPSEMREEALTLSGVADDTLMMPSFKQMRQATAMSDTMRLLGGPEAMLNSEFVDAARSKYWSPMMILRLGFIPRAMADELLPAMFRNGVGPMLNQWFVQPWHRFDAENQVPGMLRPFAAAERRIRGMDFVAAYQEHDLSKMNWVAGFEDELGGRLQKAAAGVPVKFDDLVNAHGNEMVNKLQEQWRMSGTSVGSRDASILTNMPNKFWAQRFAAYSPEEIKTTKMLQGLMQRATGGIYQDVDARGTDRLANDPVLIQPYQKDLTSKQNGWLERPPHAANGDRLSTSVLKDDGTVEQIKLNVDRTSYVRTTSDQGNAYTNALDYHIHDKASSPEAVAAAVPLNAYTGPAQRAILGQVLGVAGDPGEEIFKIQAAYTAMTPGVKDRLRLAIRQTTRADRTAMIDDLIERGRLPEEVANVAKKYADGEMDGNSLGALLVDHDGMFRDVQSVAERQAGERSDRAAAKVAKVEDPGMTREEFSAAYADARAKLDLMSNPRHDMYRPSTNAERKALEERVAHLEGHDSGVYQWARGTVPDPEAVAATLDKASVAGVDHIDHVLTNLDIPALRQQLVDANADPTLAGEIQRTLDDITIDGALPMDPQVVRSHIDAVDNLVDELSQTPGMHEAQAEVAKVYHRLRSWQDALERYDGPAYLQQPNDPDWINTLFNAHRELNSPVAQGHQPILRASSDPEIDGLLRQRDQDVWDLVVNGDAEARDRVGKANMRHELTKPHNAEVRQKMTRGRATADLRPLSPEPLDGHVAAYTPMVDASQQRAIVRKFRAEPNEGVANALEGFKERQVALNRYNWNEDEWLAQADDAPGTMIPFGSWATTDKAEAERVSKLLHDAAGAEPFEGGVGFAHVPNEKAIEYSPATMPDNQLFLPNHEMQAVKQWMPSHYADDTEIMNDWVNRNYEDMVYLATNDGPETNHALAGAIASGRPHAWDVMQAHRPDLVPESLMSPKFVADMHERPIARLFRYGFDKVIAPPIDGLVREPLFRFHFARAADEADALMRPVLANREAEHRAMDVMSRFGAKDGDQIYTEVRSMYRSLKGYFAVADADIENPVLRASAYGREAPLNLETLRFARDDGLTHLPPTLRGYLDNAEARLASAPDKAVKLARERQINQELADVAEHYRSESDLFSRVNEQAAQVAADRVQPFVDDHRIKSQFAEVGRNLMPFFWAQEQTARRWLSSALIDPSGIRKMQLGMHGLRSMGVIRKNQYGDDVFVYPGSTALQETIGRIPVFGDMQKVPVTMPLTGQAAYTVPFLQDMGVPSASPIVTIPLKLAAEQFPELAAVRDATLPPGAEQTPWYQDLMPATAARLIHTVAAGPDSDRDFAAAQLQTIATMEANHMHLTTAVEHAEDKVNQLIEKGAKPEKIAEAQRAFEDAKDARNKDGVPGPGATPTQIDVFMERTANQARIMLATKAFLGFLGPTAPTADRSNPFTEEYQTLLSKLPVQDAFAAFVKNHPDATPYTVFASQTPSGASVPATSTVDQWIDGNKDTITRFPMAAGWLAPHGGNQAYDDQAYAQQLAVGLRVRQSPEETWREMKFKEASGPYFQMQEDFQTAAASTSDDQARKGIEDEWADWRDSYLKIHGTFAEMLRTPAAAERRQKVIEQMAEMVNDPRTEVTPHLRLARELVTEHQVFTNELDKLSGDTTGAANKRKLFLRNQFSDWGDRFVRQHPQLAGLWHGVYAQEVNPRDLLLDNIRSSRSGIMYDTEVHDAPQPRAWATNPRY